MPDEHNNVVVVGGGGGMRGRKKRRPKSRQQGTPSANMAGRRSAVLREANVPQPEWNKNEWRRWDEIHGHILWMGTLQAEWSNATIAGFFHHYGAEVTITRKAFDTYCFVAFASTQEAKQFSARHNHHPLPGDLGNGIRFNIRPRTRPRWYRQTEDSSNGTGGGNNRGGRGLGRSPSPSPGNGNGNGKGNPHARRTEDGQAGRGGERRQQVRGVKTERGPHPCHQTRQARGMGRARSVDCESYGRGAGRSGLAEGRPSQGHEERSPWTALSPRHQIIAGHDRGDRLEVHSARRNTCQESWGREGCSQSRWRSRSRSRSRSRAMQRLRARSGSSSPNGRRGNRGRNGNHTRLKSGGRSSPVRGGERQPLGGERFGNTGSSGGDGRAKGIAVDDVNDVDRTAVRGQGSGRWRSNSESGKERRYGCSGGGAAEGSGRVESNRGGRFAGANGIQDARHSPNSENDCENPCKQMVASTVDQRFVGGEELQSDGLAVPKADVELDGTTNVAQRPDSGCHEIDQEGGVEAHPGQEDNPRSPFEEGGEGCNGIGRSSAGLVTGGLDPQLPNQQQSPTENDKEPFAQQADDLERGGGGRGGAGSVNQPHFQDARRHLNESMQEGSDPTDCLVNQHCGNGAAEDGTDAAGTQEEVGSVGKQTDTISSTSTMVHELDGRGSTEEEGSRFAFLQDEGDMNRGDTRCSKTSALPPPTATSKLQRHPQAGTCVARPTFSGPLFREPAGGLDRSQQDSKGGLTRSAARYATPTSTDRGVDRSRGCYGNFDGGRSGRINQRSCERTARTSQGLESGTKKKVGEARRGTKRRSIADVTLEQVIEHHMARRRLDGAANGPDGSRAGPHLRIGNASSHSTGAGADRLRAENLHSNGKRPSPCSISDGATLVVAAWSSGCILPLTEAAAPHMRLVAPLLAGEPEGRQVVLRTAAAVATGAAKLALPQHRVEVTRVWQDGILLELCPAPLVEREEGEAPAPLSALAGRLQAAFDEIVAVDLEFDTVRLCHREALEKVDTGSSSEELLKWCNEGTTDLMRFAPLPFASHIVDHVPGSGGDSLDLVELRKALARPDGSPFIGIKHGQWPLLPRTGLLGCFSVSIHPVMLPLPGSKRGEGCAHQEPAVYLALSFSDSAVFNTSGSPGVLRGHDYQSIGSSGGYTGTSSHGSARNAVGSDAAIADLPRLRGSARLECVSPMCTAETSKWRDITGLRCVAAVNRLALGSPTNLEGKLLLAEGLHTDQLGALAKTIILSDAQLVILAGRQGASADVVASCLCVELTIKGKSPAVVNTQSYRRPEAPEARTEAYMGQSQPRASSSASVSNQQLDSAALGRVVAALLGQDQDGGGFPNGNNNGGGAVSEGNAVAGARATSRGWHDIVVVHGCSALDAELLSMEDIGLRPAKAIKVFVDVVPQVCVDNVTPVNGADVRMLRALLAARGSFAKAAQAEVLSKAGNGRSIVKRSNFDAASFLDKWHVAEQREQGFWRSFQAAADVHINTALPYDLNALKPLVEPLLRSVPPPTEGSDGGDGCRSSAYALSRSVLHMLQLCEALHAQLPGTSVLHELIRPQPS